MLVNCVMELPNEVVEALGDEMRGTLLEEIYYNGICDGKPHHAFACGWDGELCEECEPHGEKILFVFAGAEFWEDEDGPA